MALLGKKSGFDTEDSESQSRVTLRFFFPLNTVAASSKKITAAIPTYNTGNETRPILIVGERSSRVIFVGVFPNGKVVLQRGIRDSSETGPVVCA